MDYAALLKDMLFDMREPAGLGEVQRVPGCDEATDETVAALLEESARFMSEVLAPIELDRRYQAVDAKQRRGGDRGRASGRPSAGADSIVGGASRHLAVPAGQF